MRRNLLKLAEQAVGSLAELHDHGLKGGLLSLREGELDGKLGDVSLHQGWSAMPSTGSSRW